MNTATPKVNHGEVLSALLAALVVTPLVGMFIVAARDGARREVEAPLRSMVGDDVFEQLQAGEKTSFHYVGQDRLAPDFTLPDARGVPWSLKDHRKKTVVLNFWSITCQPCVEEMPNLLELARIMKGRDDVEIVAVSIDRSWDDVKAIFPADPGITVLFDPEKAVVRGKFGTRLYPETWIIDPEGVIRFRYDGPYDWSSAVVVDLLDWIRRSS